MPSSFARFGEKMRQTLHVDIGMPKEWKPTSNARNEVSLAEAQAYAQAEACQTIGGGMETRRIEDGASHLRLNIQSQVIKPLASWLGAYKSIKAKMAKLEEMRLDVDAKRRDLLSYTEKLQKAGDKEKSSLEEKKNSAEEKANRLFTTFKAEEMEVFKALERLCKDSVAAKAYSKAVLEVMKGAFSIAHEAFDGQDGSEAVATPAGDAPIWYTSAWQTAPTDINYDSNS